MSTSRLSLGIPGLDRILHGGFIANRAYLVRGQPGSGKTILGLQFLLAGTQRGERSLYITLGESTNQIQENGALIGFDLSAIDFLDLSPKAEFFTQQQTYDIFAPAEVERDPVTQAIVEQIETIRPRRVFVDAMTQFRYLASDSFQFRKQILSFLNFLGQQGSTVLFTSESGGGHLDDDVQFLSDGIVNLEFFDDRRLLYVTKFRGSDFEPGKHSFKIKYNIGLDVFPRLTISEPPQEFKLEKIPSGIPAIDELLNGGIERGTVTMLTGPSGVGKTTLGTQWMKEAAGRGERSAIYLFEELEDTFFHRCEAVNIPVRIMQERGTLSVKAVD
ncbi:MAG: AAA family ATPase [Cyanobacteria bacterium SID2]|nr:AAA family ATPase [Cyanobacteria bacterium SID2]MBP0006765.1 AAA family ATPase [Cyanobacteria bacterium SBC]